jgi:thioredoxin-like negative regulator of GroEL
LANLLSFTPEKFNEGLQKMNAEIPEIIYKAEVDKIKLSNKPILLEVRNECCIQSEITDKIIKKIENEFNNRILVARIDYKTHRALFPELLLDSLPTVLLMNNSRLIKSINGTISRINLKNLVTELIESQLTKAEKK